MIIVRQILRFVLGGQKKKALDAPNERENLDKQGIKYTPATQSYDPKTEKMEIKENKEEE